MSEQTQHDDHDLEQLLRATFAAEGRRQVPESRSVPPFPDAERVATVHPLRRKWTGIALVAAALVGIAVGATVISQEAVDADKPAPPATSVAPEPTVTSSVSATTTPTTSSTPTSTGSTPPAVPTKQVTVLGVTLTVPTTWQVEPGSDVADNVGSCLTTTGQAQHQTGYAADNCELTVRVGGGLFGQTDVDRADFTPDGGICGTDGRVPDQTVTTAADEVTVDGVSAEHRVFTGNCIDFHIQQWTIPTKPFVQFTRQVGNDDPAGLARASAVVRSAKLPGPRSHLRLSDHGYITGMSGSTLQLNRVTVLQSRGTVDNNPATYGYPVAADAQILYPRPDGSTTLTLDQLRTIANGGTVAGVPPLGQLGAVVTTDGEQATRVELDDRQS